MQALPAFAVMLALATPLAVAGQPPEPILGHGIGMPDRIAGVPAVGAPFADFLAPGASRTFGMRLEYGGARGSGNGIRVSTVVDNAFGLPGDELPRGIGQAAWDGAVATP